MPEELGNSFYLFFKVVKLPHIHIWNNLHKLQKQDQSLHIWTTSPSTADCYKNKYTIQFLSLPCISRLATGNFKRWFSAWHNKAAVCVRRSSSGDLRWRGCYPCKWMYHVSLRRSSPAIIAGPGDHRRGLHSKQIPGDLRRRFMSSSNSRPTLW